jgi:GT2 family glycosyltransferase
MRDFIIPEVSIIIVNYNTYDLTCACIRSVYDKTTGIGFEVILVDNASTECDAELFALQFPGIKLAKGNINAGFAAGNNLGIKNALGKYILLLNSDTRLIENSIKFIYDQCLPLKDIGAATIKVVYPDGRLQPVARYFPHVGIHFLETSRLSRVFKNYYLTKRPPLDYNKDLIADWLWGTFYFFPKQNLEYLGGALTETFFMYGEDMEWGLLFHRAGLKNYYFSGSKVVHYLSQSVPKPAKLRMIRHNHLKFVKKYNGIFSSFVENILLGMDEMAWSIKQMQSFKKEQ